MHSVAELVWNEDLALPRINVDEADQWTLRVFGKSGNLRMSKSPKVMSRRRLLDPGHGITSIHPYLSDRKIAIASALLSGVQTLLTPAENAALQCAFWTCCRLCCL
ncbi:hypothetical protein [Paraburkholderia sp. 35.1]|uniref:hypothetical protein n=1 Tax=Paraburkholderia sp. 35.1 TaxID=2991058 RepID=UPI003D23F230